MYVHSLILLYAEYIKNTAPSARHNIIKIRCSCLIQNLLEMFRAIAILASLLGASAFSPVSKSTRSSLKMSFDKELGVLAPTGFWDPLGLSTGKDASTFKQFRGAELKHGRVAMLAVSGYLLQAIGRLPGTIDLDGTTFDSIPNGVAAIGAVSSFGWLQIVASVGYWELIGWEEVEGSSPGDFGIKYLPFYDTAEKQDDIKLRELQNGRLAMLGIIALITHDLAKPEGEGLFVLHHF